MQDYIDDSEDTLSLCDLLIEDHTIGLEEEEYQLSKPNSSSSSSSSEQDFLGFFTEEWVRNSNLSENIIFCGKIVSSSPLISGDRKQETKGQINPPFRSNSGSFRYMRLKSTSASKPSTSRSKSLPNRSVSSPICKSRWLVFMFGSGSSKFPTKIDVSDIKSRQLRRQNTMGPPAVDGGKEEGGGRSKGWWRVVDVLGCGGGIKA